jgi:arylsulfatase A-like enzyme
MLRIRRGFRRTSAHAAIAVAVLASFSSPAGCKERREAPRNILLVSLDTLRADHVGSYGHRRDTTPFLDAIAARGIRFERAFVNCHGTAPSHATLFTSRYQETHRVHYDPARVLGGLVTPIPPSLPTLAELLQAHGYRTIGVTQGGYMSSSLGFARGFDRFVEDQQMDIAAGAARLVALARPEAAGGGRPVFAFLHTYQTHAPYHSPYPGLFDDLPELVVPPGTDGAEWANAIVTAHMEDVSGLDARVVPALRTRYDRAIRFADDTLRAMFGELEKLGFLENALVLVLSDHGEEFGERGGLQHRGNLFDELLRVPLIVVPPGGGHGRIERNLVSLIDVMPTVLEFAAVRPPTTLEGRSLLAPRPGSNLVFSQYGYQVQSVRTSGWKLTRSVAATGAGPDAREVGTYRLYDLIEDPGELRDVARREPDREQAMSRVLEDLRRRGAEGAAPAAEMALTPSQVENLRSLGYLQ